MTKEQMMDFTNKQYVQYKMLEIALEQTRLAVEQKNEDIANDAVDAYTEELMAAGVF